MRTTTTTLTCDICRATVKDPDHETMAGWGKFDTVPHHMLKHVAGAWDFCPACADSVRLAIRDIKEMA